MHQAPAPLASQIPATALEAKFGPFNPAATKTEQAAHADRARRFIAYRAHFMAVISHEMGHSVGLRHNFVSSADAWNYRPQYWQLRTEDGNGTGPAEAPPRGRASGPRSFGPRQRQQRETSSGCGCIVVHGLRRRVLQDFLGSGAWDFAAARMFYARPSPVIDDPSSYFVGPEPTGARRQDGQLRRASSAWSLDDADGAGRRRIHYSDQQESTRSSAIAEPWIRLASSRPPGTRSDDGCGAPPPTVSW